MAKSKDKSKDRKGSGKKRRDSSDFQRAVSDFEHAVEDLVDAATGDFSDRATEFVEEAAQRVRREADLTRDEDTETRRSRRRRRRARRYYSRDWSSRPRRQRISRSGSLVKDPRHAKIFGVCAGIANYFGVESWVVRCLAVTGLIFMPQIVVPAYFVLHFLLDNPDKVRERGRARRSRGPREDPDEDAMVDVVPVRTKRDDHDTPAPELGTEYSPRRSLGAIRGEFDQIELKLRRMESHVTSGQYELQKELRKIEQA